VAMCNKDNVICAVHTNKCNVLSMLLYVFCLHEATRYWTFRIVAARGKVEDKMC